MREVFETMMAALPTLVEASRRGMRVDPEAALAWRGELETEQRRLLGEWAYPDVNPTAPQQVSKLLYGRWGLPAHTTKKGGWSSDELALRSLLPDVAGERKQAIEQLLALREINTNLGLFAVHRGNRIHPSFLPQDKDETKDKEKGQGAGTGRIQPRQPNTAQQPERARFLYIPDPGWVLAYLDWHAAEARVEYTRSGDSALERAVQGDLHSVLERELGVDRVRAKNVFYGTGRGAGAKKLVQTLRGKGFKLTLAEATDIQNRLFAAFPDWTAWRQAEHARAVANRLIRNPFGRRWVVYHKSIARKAVARIVQSSVADMLWRVLVDLPATGAQLLTPVHDALLVQVREPAAAERVKTLMEQTFNEIGPGFAVPVKMMVGGPGQSWGDLG